MKKILLALIVIACAIVSFLFNKYFEMNEVIQVLYEDKQTINVLDWNKDNRPEEKLKQIEAIAAEQKVNIYKVAYKPLESSQKQKIILYAALSDEQRFYKQITLESGKRLTRKDPVDHYLSSRNERDTSQVGRIELFSPDNLIEIRPLMAAESVNLRGNYVIDTQDSGKAEAIKQKLQTDVGFQVEDQEPLSTLSSLKGQKATVYLIPVLIIILIFISLSFLYYILLNFKGLAVRKLLGFSDEALIFKVLMKDNLNLHFTAFAVIFVGQVIYLFQYNGLNKFWQWGSEWFAWQSLFMLLSLAVCLFPFFIVYHINIGDMLKNKKPIKLVQFLNYTSKGLFSLLLVVLLVNIVHQYKEYSTQEANSDKWNSAKYYGFYEFQNTNLGADQEEWAYETGLKSQKLFGLANEKGAILVKPSDGLIHKEAIAQQAAKGGLVPEPYDPQEGNTLQVNVNYLNENPVYDLDGNKVSIEDSFGDRLLVLVPEMYRGKEAEIRNAYKEWYQFKRYIDVDIYREHKGMDAERHKDVEVEFRFIRNDQKHFLYNPTIERETGNFSVNSILMVVNSQNMGGDSYLNFLTSGYFFPKVGNPENTYEELEVDISKAGLGNIILSAPSLYSVIGDYMHQLQNDLKISSLVAVVLLIIQMVITIFTILNYLEKNKIIHSVKKINGFSFLRRHYHFMILSIATWLLIGLAVMAARLMQPGLFLSVLPIFLGMEIILMLSIFKATELKKTKDVLKGA